MIIGIQGGKGSFNEEACRFYFSNKINHTKNYQIKYLFNSLNVLRELNQCRIVRGLFALQNSVGGIVKETIEALSQYNCQILDEFEIIVNHCLLVKTGIKIEEIKTIISHPQALTQCKNTLNKRYPEKKLISGEKELIDQAKAAEYLANGKITSNIAVLASRVCADLYGLEILDRGLQDKKENYTTFLFIKKRE